MRDLLLSAAHPGQVGCWLLFFCLHLPCHFFSFFCSYLLYLKDPSPSWGGGGGVSQSITAAPHGWRGGCGQCGVGGLCWIPVFSPFFVPMGCGSSLVGGHTAQGVSLAPGGALPVPDSRLLPVEEEDPRCAPNKHPAPLHLAASLFPTPRLATTSGCPDQTPLPLPHPGDVSELLGGSGEGQQPPPHAAPIPLQPRACAAAPQQPAEPPLRQASRGAGE